MAGFSNLYDVTSLGDCGCGIRVMKASTNLLSSVTGFKNIKSNRVPRRHKLWCVGTTNVNGFCRVMETD
ncbi:MAG: hypothetical protein O3B24_09645 [Verrucomicrobia bacterium]|nr:hypothetical protein [Verrucomicrobiota bacterium]